MWSILQASGILLKLCVVSSVISGCMHGASGGCVSKGRVLDIPVLLAAVMRVSLSEPTSFVHTWSAESIVRARCWTVSSDEEISGLSQHPVTLVVAIVVDVLVLSDIFCIFMTCTAPRSYERTCLSPFHVARAAQVAKPWQNTLSKSVDCLPVLTISSLLHRVIRTILSFKPCAVCMYVCMYGQKPCEVVMC
jgi:hypothetical protein